MGLRVFVGSIWPRMHLCGFLLRQHDLSFWLRRFRLRGHHEVPAMAMGKLGWWGGGGSGWPAADRGGAPGSRSVNLMASSYVTCYESSEPADDEGIVASTLR